MHGGQGRAGPRSARGGAALRPALADPGLSPSPPSRTPPESAIEKLKQHKPVLEQVRGAVPGEQRGAARPAAVAIWRPLETRQQLLPTTFAYAPLHAAGARERCARARRGARVARQRRQPARSSVRAHAQAAGGAARRQGALLMLAVRARMQLRMRSPHRACCCGAAAARPAHAAPSGTHAAVRAPPHVTGMPHAHPGSHACTC